jgi:hypothetical protein
VAEIISRPINSGDPVTAEIINNLVLDLNKLNQATAPTFKLTLDSTGAGAKQDAAAVSQKVYSTVIPASIKTSSKKGGTWDFTKSNIKFATTPRCWVQVQNSNTSLPATAFTFTVVITAVSTKSMTFQVRGNFSEGTHDFVCFAADA